jgi:glucose/arabinose dehydrogenase
MTTAAGSLMPAVAASSDPPADLVLDLVAGGFVKPAAVTGAGDNSGRIFVVEQAGTIEILGGGTFLDISARVVDTENEEGLLGLAFHPDFAANGYFYVNYTYDVPGSTADTTRVSRFQVSVADPNLADAGSELILLEIDQPYDNHNGGDLHFGPDGYLYIATGDGGGSGDPGDRARRLDNLLGKILRIDVDGGNPYAIPADNPFVGDGAARDEIWAYGLRNPWRFSFDRANGDLFIGDVGQGSREEIDYQPASSVGGENYGWRCMEGDQEFNPASCTGETLTLPILVYDHGLGCAVTGGFLYRGNIGGLHGRYVFADYCSGRIWFATPGVGGWTSDQWSVKGFGQASFGEDDDGELYLADRDDGTVSRFYSPGAIFTDLFDSGDASRWTAVVGE